MLIIHKRSFAKGLMMAILFVAVLIFMFTPSFGGVNAFRAADQLFNSIAKGSTYYIPGLIDDVAKAKGQRLDLSLKMPSGESAARAEKLVSTAGCKAGLNGTSVDMSCDVADLLGAALKDSDAMFHNRGEEMTSRYGMPEKEALLSWWNLLGATVKALKAKEEFKKVSQVEEVMKRGVAVGYNFYGIEPQQIKNKIWIVAFSLIFYVIYTLWWGFAIFYLVEGFGLQLKAGAKKEV